MHDSQKGRARHTASKTADYARFEVNHERVAEALGHKRNSLIIGGEVGALTKMSEHFHVWGERLKRVALFALPAQAGDAHNQHC